MRAQRADQALGHDAEQGRVDQIGRYAEIEHAGDGRRRVVGVQGGQHQMARQGRLDGHLGRFQIADFADHHDVRVLPHQGAHAIGETEIDAVLDLHLVERGLDHFDRVLNGAHVHFRRRQLLQCRVQRRRLAGTGGAGDQDDAVRRGGHLLPAQLVVVGKAERAKIADQHFRIENAHDQLFAEGGRQGRQTKLHLLSGRRPGLDPAVLRPPLLDDVHPSEQFDAAGHGVHHRHRNLVHLMQHAVDAEAHDAEVAPGFDMDVRCPLLEGVLPQPINDMDDVLVVGIEGPVGLAQFDQLLETRQAARHLAARRSLLDRFGQVEELDQVAADVVRVGHHPANVLAQDVLQFGHPLANEGFGRGNHHLARRHLDRQDAEAGRVSTRHHFSDTGEVDFQGIDMQVVEPGTAGQPFSQVLEIEHANRRLGASPFLIGNHDQRVNLAAMQAPLALQGIGRSAVDQAVLDHPVEHLGKGQAVFAHVPVIHARQYSTQAGSSPSRQRLRLPVAMPSLALPQRAQQIGQTVVVDFLHQGQQATNLAGRKAFPGEPVQVVARQVGDQAPLVLAERHGARDQ